MQNIQNIKQTGWTIYFRLVHIFFFVCTFLHYKRFANVILPKAFSTKHIKCLFQRERKKKCVQSSLNGTEKTLCGTTNKVPQFRNYREHTKPQ